MVEELVFKRVVDLRERTRDAPFHKRVILEARARRLLRDEKVPRTLIKRFQIHVHSNWFSWSPTPRGRPPDFQFGCRLPSLVERIMVRRDTSNYSISLDV